MTPMTDAVPLAPAGLSLEFPPKRLKVFPTSEPETLARQILDSALTHDRDAVESLCQLLPNMSPTESATNGAFRSPKL